MKKHFEGIGEVTFEKLSVSRINELTELIHETYQREKIWVSYSKEQIETELLCAFTNLNYKPTYYIAILNDKIIGCGSFMWSHTSSNVFELSFGTVHPDYQRKGIGKALTSLRLTEIIQISNEDSVVVTVSRRPKFFEQYNFKTHFDLKNENELSYFMSCKVIDLHNYKTTKLGLTDEKWEGHLNAFLSKQTETMGTKRLHSAYKKPQEERYVHGIVPKDSSHKSSKIYNELKAIPGTNIGMVKGIIFIDGDRPKLQQYLDANRDLFEYTG